MEDLCGTGKKNVRFIALILPQSDNASTNDLDMSAMVPQLRRYVMKLKIILVIIFINFSTVVFAADVLSIIVIHEAASINEVSRKADGIYVGNNHIHADKGATLKFDRWQADVGKIKVTNYPVKEYVRMLEGRVVITNTDGTKKEFTKGQAFIIPKGFTGEWDVQEKMLKEYIKITEPLMKSRKKPDTK